uniref:Uncharacterized protein n=1 Tax=Oryza brachyantha TaxID=4533 RepID=J3L1W5_ORYBR
MADGSARRQRHARGGRRGWRGVQSCPVAGLETARWRHGTGGVRGDSGGVVLANDRRSTRGSCGWRLVGATSCFVVLCDVWTQVAGMSWVAGIDRRSAGNCRARWKSLVKAMVGLNQPDDDDTLGAVALLGGVIFSVHPPVSSPGENLILFGRAVAAFTSRPPWGHRLWRKLPVQCRSSASPATFG